MSFKFDATAPTAPAVKILAGGGTVTLEWPSAAGAASYEILREVPAKHGRASLLWHGTGRRFVDHSVKNGTRYRYVVRARDQAGNTAEKRVDVTPLLPVFAPAPGTVTKVAPLFAEVADPKAQFYNVQVYRGRTKVLSRWPTTGPFRIPRAWSFGGRRRSSSRGNIASSSGPRSDRPSIRGTGSSWVRRASSGRRRRCATAARRPAPRA